MKSASPAALAFLSTGQFVLAELFDLTLTTGQVYRFTGFQTPLVAGLWNDSSVGAAHTYGTGLTISRKAISQKVGTQAGSMQVTLAPQPDSPFGPVLIAGYPLLQACRYGFLDGALIQMSVLVMPTPLTGQLDTSSGGTPFFLGTAQDIQPDRLSVDITVDDYLAYMSTQQMPRNCWQTGCSHLLYDVGCDPAQTLKASKTVTGTIASASDGAHFTTSLTQVDDYFDLGTITFTSGANSGLGANVASFKNASGAIVTRFPFPVAPAAGDSFSIFPGCDKQQATCVNKFNRLSTYSGFPYIPVAETILDGGTETPPTQAIGQQAGQIIGSQTTGRRFPSNPGFYQP